MSNISRKVVWQPNGCYKYVGSKSHSHRRCPSLRSGRIPSLEANIGMIKNVLNAISVVKYHQYEQQFDHFRFFGEIEFYCRIKSWNLIAEYAISCPRLLYLTKNTNRIATKFKMLRLKLYSTRLAYRRNRIPYICLYLCTSKNRNRNENLHEPKTETVIKCDELSTKFNQKCVDIFSFWGFSFQLLSLDVCIETTIGTFYFESIFHEAHIKFMVN